MTRNGFAVTTALILVLSSVVVGGEDAKTQYSSMAPLDQYLMDDRNAEMALARSAAPRGNIP